MSTFQESGALYDMLRDTLAAALASQSFKISQVSKHGHLLLVLEKPSDAVGFAILNGSPEEAYFSVYESFKNLYRERRTDWHRRTMSLVICRSDRREQDDEFFSSVESDVYFCRKYVIHIQEDRAALDSELDRLPFLPLRGTTAGGPIRPPSARDLLQTIDVGRELARRIVEPGRAAPASILRDALQDREYLPQLRQHVGTHAEAEFSYTESTQTRVTAIEIEAFRAYRKRQRFELDADVIVLYGLNGLGKTSLYDAFDYVCTGRIGRLCRRSTAREEFQQLAGHLGVRSSRGEVVLEIEQGNASHKVSRYVDDWSYAHVDDRRFGRTQLLKFITSAQGQSSKARIENLESLFRATHLFSQSDPELFQSFQSKSILPADLVSRMLALEDYTSGIAKCQDVAKLTGTHLRVSNAELQDVANRIKDAGFQLNNLPTTSDTADYSQITKMGHTFLRKVRALTRIVPKSTKVTTPSVREWRGLAEAAKRERERRHSHLEELRASYGDYERRHVALAEQQTKLDGLSEALATANTQVVEMDKKAGVARADLARTAKKVTALVNKRQHLKQLRGLLDRASVIREQLTQRQDATSRLRERVQENEVEGQQLSETHIDFKKRETEAKDALSSQAEQCKTLRELLKEHGEWKAEEESAERLAVAIERIETRQSRLKNEQEQEEEKLLQVRHELRENQHRYKCATERQDNLTGLLDQLEQHVRDSVCPVCGAEHGKKDTLLQKIRCRKESRDPSVNQLAARNNKLVEALRNSKDCLEAKKRDDLRAGKGIAKLKRRLSRTQQLLSLYEEKLKQCDLSKDQPELFAELDRLLAKHMVVSESYSETLVELQERKQANALRLEQVRKQDGELQESLRDSVSISLDHEKELVALTETAEALGWPLDTPLDKLDSLDRNCEADTTRARSDKESLALLSDKLENDREATQAHVHEIETSLASVKKKRKQQKAGIDRYNKALRSVIKLGEPTLDTILEEVARSEDELEKLDDLIREALFLEQATDAAARSVRRAELEREIEKDSAKRKLLQQTCKKLHSIREWFQEIEDVLSRWNVQAVEDHVQSFGPLTTTIQKRLHPVYGFGDITLDAHGREIRVATSWANKELRPTDYFSESEKQILKLSLFLAEILTQSWSGFAPILLDDPVTHFDDINAFGFVELIRGILNTAPNRRQFVISTCEDSLYELMKAKLANISGRAIFYQFDGIGADGPVISRWP